MEYTPKLRHTIVQLNLYKAFNYNWTTIDFPLCCMYNLIIVYNKDENKSLHDTIQCESSNYKNTILKYLHRRKYISDDMFSICITCNYDVFPINKTEVIFIRHDLPSMCINVNDKSNLDVDIKRLLDITEKDLT